MLSLIGFTPSTLLYPQMSFDNTGLTNYNATTHALTIDATPGSFKITSTSLPKNIIAPSDFLLNIKVDNSGHLIGGVDGPDLVVTGSISGIGSGTLLTGEISQFGFLDGTTDTFDFRITPTGGILKSYYTGKDLGIVSTSLNSTFANDFTVDFHGGAKGTLGATAPLLSSLAGNVYTDLNNNGLFEPGLGETGIAGVGVTLDGTTVDGITVNQTATTNVNGAYSFTNLRPGTYNIIEMQPAGYLDGKETVGTQDGLVLVGDNILGGIPLDAGVNGTGNNFGELPLLPAIQLVKLTNGTHDPNVPAGDPVTWTYEVTNTGNAALGGITVSDDDPAITPVYQSGETDGNNLLDPGETWIYAASGIAVPGQYANTGTAGGTASDATGTVHISISTTDVDHYFGINPQLQLVKSTNGTHNPNLEAGSLVTWTYEVANPGNVALMNLTVTDNQGVIPVYVSGDIDINNLLDPGETWIYAATGTAIVGQYSNTGTATAADATGTMTTPISVTGDDGYFGVQPGIQIVKLTNGTDNANANLAAGSTVTWTYEVTNTGNVALSNVAVIDDATEVTPVLSTADANGLLDIGETWVYTATGTVIVGQYANTGTATGTDATGTVNVPVSASEGDSYFGVQPGIQIVKLTNGTDNANANLAAGSTVTWTYEVTNTGNVALSNVAVIDDATGVTPVLSTADANGLLDVGETWIYTATGTVIVGQYANTGTATGTDATGTVNVPLSASEGDSYFGVQPGIQIIKKTNGTDNANPNVAAGSTVTWTYIVTNTGNVTLNGVTVSDSTPGVTPFFFSGDNGNGLLDVGETWIYAAIGTAIAGQYNNTGTATGTDATSTVATPVSASEGDSYFGVQPGIQIIKLTNGIDNANANLAPGSAVTWTYNVTNTGNVALSGVAVVDDAPGVAPVLSSGDDGNGLLDLGETWVFTATGTAVAGQYNNTGTATSLDATGTITTPVSASEADSYFGVQPGIQIVKLTNGTDNNTAPGAQVTAGSTVTWTFDVTNGGNVALSNITVTDSDSAVTPGYQSGDANSNNLLDLGETWVYIATGTAIAGQYVNTGTASGIDASGTIPGTVSSSDVDYYYGASQQPASKSGYVYIDNNNDGIKQAGEAGIQGVKIILTGTNDLGQSVQITTTTDANGLYLFASLRPGTYTVTEVQPTGQGGGGCGDHGDDGDSGEHKAYMYQWSEDGIRHFELHNLDGSIRQYSSSSNSSLLDNIFAQLDGHDWNNDDLNWDDEGLKDTLFRGLDTYNNQNSDNSDDNYFANHFADFWNGIHVKSGKPGSAYYLDGKDTAGSDGGIAGNDVISNIVLNWGDHATDNNFGELLPASVSGNVYVDSNNDGIKQAGEKGISRAKVTLTGADDLGNVVQLTTITDYSGSYKFMNLRPGTYTLTETQPANYLDGKDAIGTQGGVAGNDVLSNIVLASGVKGAGNNFGEVKPASLSGFIFLDKNSDGDIDSSDRAIANVTVTLTGVDDLGNSISLSTVTDEDGHYVFNNLRPGTYTITETQPAGYLDGIDIIGSQGGTVGNDQFSNIVLQQGVRGINNNFSELASANTALHAGQTATIGFWNSKRGQALINSLNGSSGSTQLGNWLATMFPNMYGASAGSRNLTGKTNAQIASFFKQVFNVSGMKIDAQALAVALAIYVTNSNLAGNVAAGYGFIVNTVGTGAATFNIGNAGAAFNVANNTTMTIFAIMQKTNDQAKKGILWDLNGNGSISCLEQILRSLANDVFSDINETGDIR